MYMYGFVTRGLERSRTVFQPAGHEWRLHPTLRVTSRLRILRQCLNVFMKTTIFCKSRKKRVARHHQPVGNVTFYPTVTVTLIRITNPIDSPYAQKSPLMFHRLSATGPLFS